MPPVTRRVATNPPLKKQPARKPRTTRPRQTSDSWDLHVAEDDRTPEPDFAITNGAAFFDDDVVATRELTDVHQAMNPLREMAERVGREVETFAVRLDQFLEQLPTASKFEAVLGLVEEFKDLSKDAAHQLEESSQRERADLLRMEWSQQAKLSTTSKSNTFSASTANRLASSTASKSEAVQQWRRFTQEADLWELFRVMLSLHHNPDKHALEQAKDTARAELGQPHRYTSESVIWEHFLLDNDLARERLLVKQWLEETVDHQQSDVQGIMDELEKRADHGMGLWASGWMETRERIKGEKRLRSWPTSPGVPLPQIRNRDNTELLVTTLDPDARSRQERTLEKADLYSERAMWIACWEMLRRGRSWADVSEWCGTRSEGWRALSIGKGSDANTSVSNAAWRKMCYLTSQSGCSSDYEAAVYGLLGGSIKTVNKVCRTVDDTLYAYYNAALLRQFDQYLATNFPERAPLARRVNEDALQNPEDAIVSLIQKLREHPSTSTESIEPMKIIQSYLLANDVGSLIHTLGHSIAYLDSQQGTPGEMIVPLNQFWNGNSNLPEAEIALDPQTLRIATHMAIILRVLSEEQLDGVPRDAEDGVARDAEENVTVAYIQTLRAAAKRDLIPIYASRLSSARSTITMSQVLQDVTDYNEQEELLKLLAQYQLDNVKIINEQLSYMLARNVGDGVETPLSMLEQNALPNQKLYPGQNIVAGFLLPTDLTEEDAAVVRSLRWFTIIEGHWNDTFSALSLALRKCLVAGRLACAVAIIQEFPCEQISMQKSYSILGTTVNVIEYDSAPSNVDPELWQDLIDQSRTYRELEILVRALEALADWRDKEHEYTGNHQNQFRQSRAPSDIREAKTTADECMELVLNGILLSPSSAEEHADLEKIRVDYIPEMVLAYNTVLHTAGSLISRQALIESMDLSVKVAKEENRLVELFVKSKRMQELVTSFAMTSKAMLVLKESGREWKPKRDREGKDLGMWETTAPVRPSSALEDVNVPQQISF